MAHRPVQPIRAWMPHLSCFYLFLALILLILLLPAFDHSATGQLWFSAASLLVLVMSLVTFGRSRFTLWAALLPVGPALVLLVLFHATGHRMYQVWSWRFSVVVLVATLVPLLRYVLGPEVMTRDKLFGGTASYMLLGLLWCYFYALAEHFSPGSFDGLPSGPVHVADMVFLSFGTLTTGGLADIVPREKMVHTLVILEELTGTLFMAVVVATRGELSPPGGDRLTATASRVTPKRGSLRTTSLSGATTPAPPAARPPAAVVDGGAG